jgi:aspartate kinase
LASHFAEGKTGMTLACDTEWLDALARTLQKSKDLRRQREASSSVSLTCFGGVSSDLPLRALQVLRQHGIVADEYLLSPHSVTLFVAVASREAAVRALHTLVL